MVEESEILVEKRDGFATLAFNRPEKRNALTAQLLTSLTLALEELARDDGIRCVVLKGTGDSGFSVGMDLADMALNRPKENYSLISEGGPLRRAIAAIEAFPYPVIAMINGYAMGAACELAIACDLRIGCERTRMGTPSAKLGIVYPLEGCERFSRTLGLATTRKLFHTARYFEGDELHKMGMLDFVRVEEELEGFTFELAREIAMLAPLSVKGQKRALDAIAGERVSPDVDYVSAIHDMVADSIRSADAKEGIQAFLERRDPRFTGH